MVYKPIVKDVIKLKKEGDIKMENNKERIELGCHTKMSQMYGLDKVEDYIDEAISRNWNTIGITDINSTQSFMKAQMHLERIEKEDFKIIYGIRTNFINDEDINKKIYDIVIYVKEQVGLKNLYTLLSIANTNLQKKEPVILKSQLDKYREGLLYGTAGNKGELYENINLDKSEINKIAKYYDFIEIEPLYNCSTDYEKEETININKKILGIGNELNIIVIATSNCKFINKEDKICNKVLNYYKGINPVKTDNERYMHTTEELLNEFNYLGKEKAYEVVVENTNLLANHCSKINTIVTEHYYPFIENSKEIIKEETYNKAHEIYGASLPKEVEKRLELELNSILENNFESIYIIASQAVKKSKEEGYLVGARGSIGNSFVAYLLGITDYNPIEYNLQFEIFAGKDFDREPDIDLNFSQEIRDKIDEFIKQKYGKDKVIYGGTISTFTDRAVSEMIDKYSEDFNVTIKEKDKIINKIVGVKKCTGIHPGGLLFLPKEKEITEFSPVEKNNSDGKIKTHFDYHSLYNLYKFDVLRHDMPTILHKLQEITGVNPKTINLEDEETLSLFLNKDDINTTKGIPEFGTKYVINMLKTIKPRNFNDLVSIDGLSHGTDTWIYNADTLLREKTATIDEVISNRDDIMNYLIRKGIERSLAYDITTFIRRGKAARTRSLFRLKEVSEDIILKWDEYEKIMKEHDIPEWYIKSCQKIKYLFPKAHTIGYTIDAFRIAWYKVYYPKAFYKVYFEVASEIDIEKYTNVVQVKNRIQFLKNIQDDKTIDGEQKCKYNYEIEDLEILLEMFERGVKTNDYEHKDVYSLINSRAIGDYCREIEHKFNTEELAVLIFRNKRMSIDEKIAAYKDLIDNYPDMEVIKRINCEHYDSVKDMIKGEINRLEQLRNKLLKNEENVAYTYLEFNKSTSKYERGVELRNLSKTFEDVHKKVNDAIEEYDDTLMYKIIKKSLVDDKDEIIAEYIVENKKSKLVNIIDVNDNFLDIDNIFLNIPTPFKKGDILVSWSDTPFKEGILPNQEDIFVLDWLCTWQENLNELLKKGNKDSSDMCAQGYYIYDEDSEAFIREIKWDYDSFEYFDGELKGINRILKGISSLKKDKIDIELFIHAYEQMKKENSYMNCYTDEGLELAGFSKKDILRLNGKNT